MRTNFFKKIRWVLAMYRLQLTGFTAVANRIIQKGVVDDTEITIIHRTTTMEDGYSREELLRMLQLIREHEEKMRWTVPEPVRCCYCGHFSPVNENGFCPVLVENPNPAGKKLLECCCPTHKAGLSEAWRKTVNKELGLKTESVHGSQVPLDDKFTINPSAASTGSLQDG